jgi:limonene-1,2-epoxide hydrolase
LSGIQTIEAFIAAWNRLDMPAIEGAMAPDIFYHNIPMEPVTGIEGFRAFMAQMPAVSAYWELHAIAENGRFVLTERTDNFVLPGGKNVSIRVMGTFEIEEGKIKAWRDYFDLGQLTSQMSV